MFTRWSFAIELFCPGALHVTDFIIHCDCYITDLSVLFSLSSENMTSEERRENYLCDITYVTNSELGFDYLRDNLATESNICNYSVET